MLDITQINALQAKLLPMLRDLLFDKIEVIEYGDPKVPSGGVMSHLRIRYIATPGGMQFGIRVVSNHVEGSGFYTTDENKALTYAMDLVLHYHRDTPMRARMRAMYGSPDLTFFVPNNEDLSISETKGSGLVAMRMRGFPTMQEKSA